MFSQITHSLHIWPLTQKLKDYKGSWLLILSSSHPITMLTAVSHPYRCMCVRRSNAWCCVCVYVSVCLRVCLCLQMFILTWFIAIASSSLYSDTRLFRILVALLRQWQCLLLNEYSIDFLTLLMFQVACNSNSILENLRFQP